jgi:TonB family protein
MKTNARNTVLAIAFLAAISSTPLRATQEGTISDKEIKVVDFADLEYPALARTAHIQGIVVVRANLDDKGKVVEAVAISGTDVLIPACLDNAKKWRFQPNPRKTVVIVYNFRMTSAVSKSGCSHFMLEAPNFATITSCVPEIR